MAAYALLSTYSTVQVLSPQLTRPVVQCTISTSPSGVIASMAIDQGVFDAGATSPELEAFANAIEQIMARTEVVAAVGGQSIDANGLISDNVVFTVSYPAGAAPSGAVTAEAVVPVASLNFEDGLIGSTLLENVLATIDGVYSNLQNAATG